MKYDRFLYTEQKFTPYFLNRQGVIPIIFHLLGKLLQRCASAEIQKFFRGVLFLEELLEIELKPLEFKERVYTERTAEGGIGRLMVIK